VESTINLIDFCCNPSLL